MRTTLYRSLQDRCRTRASLTSDQRELAVGRVNHGLGGNLADVALDDLQVPRADGLLVQDIELLRSSHNRSNLKRVFSGSITIRTPSFLIDVYHNCICKARASSWPREPSRWRVSRRCGFGRLGASYSQCSGLFV